MKKKKRPFLAVLLPALLISASLIAAYVLLLKRDMGAPPKRPGTSSIPVQRKEAPRKDTGAAGIGTPSGIGVNKTSSRPRVAIIIDDLGYHRDVDLQLIRLDLPLSFAILPWAPFTNFVTQEASRRGRELLLHQPMEPRDYPCIDPGVGALLLSMDEVLLKETLHKNLRQVPGARGVNNHMGSSFTENRDKMSMVLRELRKLGLFYVDSRTTNGTVGLEEAKKIGVPAAERTIFLDNNPGPEAISAQIRQLMTAAKRSGSAIGIGHPYWQTVEIIKKYRNTLKDEVSLVPVSELVR